MSCLLFVFLFVEYVPYEYYLYLYFPNKKKCSLHSGHLSPVTCYLSPTLTATDQEHAPAKYPQYAPLGVSTHVEPFSFVCAEYCNCYHGGYIGDICVKGNRPRANLRRKNVLSPCSLSLCGFLLDIFQT